MNAYELKRNVQATGSHFFDRETMAHFGDTMKNLEVVKFPINLATADGSVHLCWVLKRKARTYKGAPVAFWFFDTTTFAQVVPT